jgi:23S rRNA (uridine2552-2'-O)-methyltransferase
MKRQAKTRAWHQQHVSDFYVRQSVGQGYRSRAAYKLMEIDDKDHLFPAGRLVVDLGCAPGGWCQVAVERMKGQGKIVGIDLLEVVGLHGVTMIQGDFTEETTLRALEATLQGRRPDLVLSDMAPNITGVAVADQAHSYGLAELALNFAAKYLQADGSFLVKVFQGAGFEAFMREMRGVFQTVVTRKPKASRDRSRELYLLGHALKETAVIDAGPELL